MALLDRVKTRIPEITDDTQDALLEELILSAREIFISLRHPVTSPPVDAVGKPVIEPRWDGWIVSAAVELYNRLGAEGQLSHSENGVSRGFEAADLSTSLCGKVTPFVGVVSRAKS